MKGLVAVGLISSGVAAGLSIIAAEVLGHKFGDVVRSGCYWGTAAGVVLALVGLPFAIKMASFGKQPDKGGMFWIWWGVGMIARLMLLVALSLALLATYLEQSMAPLLSMMGVYLVGMLAESAWVARLLFAAHTNENTRAEIGRNYGNSVNGGSRSRTS